MKKSVVALLMILACVGGDAMPTAAGSPVTITAPGAQWRTSVESDVAGDAGWVIWARAVCYQDGQLVFEQKQMIVNGGVTFHFFPYNAAVESQIADCIASIGWTQSNGVWKARASDTFKVCPPELFAACIGT